MNLTQWILCLLIVGLIIYDVFAKPTLSQALRDWGKEFVGLPFCAGLLLGHWFLNHSDLWLSGWMYALPIILGLVAWDIVWNLKPRPLVWYRHPAIYASLGVAGGAIFWGQG